MGTTTTSFEIIVGDDKEFIDNTRWNYTDFQVEFMLQLMDRTGFETFVTHGHDVGQLGGKSRKPGMVSVLWYEDGVLNGISLGTEEVKCATMRAVK